MHDIINPSPEASTAGWLFKLSSELAFSNEPGSTNQAIEISKKADAIAKLEIRKRTDEYTSLKWAVDTAIGEINERMQAIKQGRELVKKAREIAQLVDQLVQLAVDLIP